MNLSNLPLSLVSKLKDFGIGVAKGVGTLAESPGYLADLVAGNPKITAPTGTLQNSQRWQQMTTPTNKAQTFGHAVGSISPGMEVVTPGLKKIGVPGGLAFGVGLGIDILTPGPDQKIINNIKNKGEYLIRRTNPQDIQEINSMGSHIIKEGKPIVYDTKTLEHYQKTLGSSAKTERLSPSQTVEVVLKPNEILPNPTGVKDSYLYVKKSDKNSLSIVQIIDSGDKLRISNGGFVIKDTGYLEVRRKIKKALLEGRPQSK